jgi:glycosyltransferase involved in cell wall biosynthesis
MRRDGLDARYLSLIEACDVPYLRYYFGEEFSNPERLEGVSQVVIQGPLFGSHHRIAASLVELRPDVILARGYIAALLLGRAKGEIPVVYSVAGWPESSESSRYRRRVDVARLADCPPTGPRRPLPLNERELEAFDRCDLAIACSPLAERLAERLLPPSLSARFFPDALWAAEWTVDAVRGIEALRKPHAERTIDLLFVASSWHRWEKNLPLVRRIVDQLSGLRMHVVGESPAIAETVHHGMIGDRRQLMEMLGNAKAIVVPSLVDGAPGVLFEAAAMGANVVASKHCGNWQICNDALLVEPFSEAGFVNACRRAAAEHYPDRLDWFIETRSYAKLMDILRWI